MAETHTDGLNVLVVEDNEDAATIEALVLEMDSHVVTIASDGLAAVRKVQENTPDVVLLDIGLPGLDGYDVAERIHDMKLQKRPLIIAVTARNDPAEMQRSRAAGIDIHLVKPVPPDTLCLVMRGVARVLR
jgi:CheY-like chemotaxis protein